jgi:phospholipase/lecithinase/hemolysin
MMFQRASRKLRSSEKSRAPQSAARPTGIRKAQLQLETLEDRTLLSSSPIGNLVVFGDSLADVGNASTATAGTFPPSSIYFQGRFSNGPIWVDTLAKYLGESPLQPSTLGGLDYAFGGATVAVSNTTLAPPFNQIPMVGQQVGLYLSGHTPAANDVFAMNGGANDFFDTVSSSTGPISPFASADALASSVATLVSAGARQFVVANVPALGETPFIAGFGIPSLSQGADQWAAGFDYELGADLASLQASHPNVTIVTADMAGLLQKITQNPSSYGFVNTTDATGPLAPGSVLLTSVTASNAQNYLFFDGVHPTSKASELLGLQAAASFDAALGINHLVVASTADTVDPLASGLSLREQVNLANNLPAGTTITFNLGSGLHQIKLTGQELLLTQSINIDGPGNGSLTINGQGLSRIFEVGANADVSMSDLTLTGGNSGTGGAINNAGVLDLHNVVMFGNTAQQGGAVYNTGTLHVNDSVLTLNTATGGSLAEGGAVANVGTAASTSVFDTIVAGNSAHGTLISEGGGLANLGGGSLQVEESVIFGNIASGVNAYGGGVFNDSGSSLSIEDSLVIANAAVGNAGKGSHGYGGGLYLGHGSLFTETNSLILANSASSKGGNEYAAS